MSNSWKELFAHPAVVAVIAGAVGGLPPAVYTYKVTQAIETQKLSIERAQKFDATTKDIVEAAKEFVDAINQNKDLKPGKSKIQVALASQLIEVNQLKVPAKPDLIDLLNQYRDSISDFNNFTQSTATASDIGRWAEKFGQVLHLKTEIGRALTPA